MSQNQKYKGKCKYCHLEGHIIDKCPTIICKYCKAVGHPNWLCKSNPNAENRDVNSNMVSNNNLFLNNVKEERNKSKNVESPNLRNKKSIYGFDSTQSLSNMRNIDSTQSLSNMRNIDSTQNSKQTNIRSNNNNYGNFKSDFVEKEEVKKVEIVYNIKYYESMMNKKWGNITMNI